jgi:ribosome-associated toxin RatA of RatAB toxin-antitoxin module
MLNFDMILVGLEIRFLYLSNDLWHASNSLRRDRTIHLKLSFNAASRLREKLTLSYFISWASDLSLFCAATLV